MAYIYPKEITDCMRSCILAIFWPKDHIVDFLRRHGCTEADLQDVLTYREQGLNRAQIVDLVFDRLHRRKDGGIGQFRSMLKALKEWDTFDHYYFNKLGKLDEKEARRCISHLGQLQEIRDAKLEQARKEAEVRTRSQQTLPRLEDLHREFRELFRDNNTSRQDRGYRLERILLQLAQREGLPVSEPFRVVGEQIDGALKFDGENYILEAKWQDSLTASNALYHFAYKVEGKMYGRGLFISVNGFSAQAVAALRSGKSLKTVLIDGGDLGIVLEGHVTFATMLDAKIRMAQTEGRIYVDPISLKDKHGSQVGE